MKIADFGISLSATSDEALPRPPTHDRLAAVHVARTIPRERVDARAGALYWLGFVLYERSPAAATAMELAPARRRARARASSA